MMRTVNEAAAAPTTPSVPGRRALSWSVLLSQRVALGVLGFGVLLRLVRYLSDRSLWLDESYLAINLMTRPYRALLQTLDYNQGAPIGFLWAERFALDVFGDSELSLRFFPLLVGLASLVLFYLVAREVLQPLAFLIALVLFATMEPFVRSSAEVKQYGLDVAVTLGLLYVFPRVVETGNFSVRRALVLAVAGPLAVSLSHPSVFVLAGVATAGLYVALRARDFRALTRQAAAYGVWLLSFLVVYLVAVRDLRELQDTVRGVGSGTGGKVKNLYTIFNDPGEFPRTAVGLAATVALVGIVFLWRRRPGVVVFFGATTCALLVAGSLGLYPIGQRFLVFFLPIVVLCLAEGIAGIVENAPRLLAAALLLGVAVLIVAPVVGTATKRLVAPPNREEIEPLLQELASSWRQGDVLYLDPGSQYAFRYYVECSDCGPVASRARVLWPSRPTSGGQPQQTPAIVSESPSLVVGTPAEGLREQLARHARVWLLYTHVFPRTDEELLEEADRSGRRIGCTRGGASLLCLYDFS